MSAEYAAADTERAQSQEQPDPGPPLHHRHPVGLEDTPEVEEMEDGNLFLSDEDDDNSR